MTADSQPVPKLDFRPVVTKLDFRPVEATTPSWSSSLEKALKGLFPGQSVSAMLGDLSTYYSQKEGELEKRQIERAARGKPAGGQAEIFVPGSISDLANFLSNLTSLSGLAQIAAATVLPEVMLPYFAWTGSREAIKGRQPGETRASALQRRLFGGAQVVGSVAGSMAEPMRAATASHVEMLRNAPEKMGGFLKKSLRSLTGADAAAIQEYEEEYAPKLEEATQRHAEKVQENKERFLEARRAYDEKVKENIAEARQAHEKLVSKLKEEYLEKSKEAEVSREAAGKREALESAKETVSRKVTEDTHSLRRSVRSALNARWDALRRNVGINTPVDMAPVSEAIDKAITDDLRGDPPGLAIFNRMLQESPEEELPEGAEERIAKANQLISMGMTPGDIVTVLREQYPKAQAEAIAPLLGTVPGEALPEMTFDGARIRYSSLGDKMSTESIPGNVYRALARVRKALGETLEKTAEDKGQGDPYRSLLRDWKEYSYDWKGYKPGESGRASISMGGSPLYRLANAEDPETAFGILTGPARERLVAQLKKYGGGSSIGNFAALAGKIDAEIKKTPKVKAEAMRQPEVPRFPKFAEPGALKPPEEREPKFVPPRKLTPEEIRLRRLRKMRRYLVWRKMLEFAFLISNLYHGNIIKPVAGIASLEAVVQLLASERFINWVAKD